MSHEETITIKRGNKWYVIPTVVGGKRLQAFEAAERAMKTKGYFGVFSSQGEADRYARARSSAYPAKPRTR